MKKLFLFILIFGMSISLNAQCKQQQIYDCSIGGCAILIKDFNIKVKKGSAKKFILVLNKGTKYRFKFCDTGIKDSTELRLYDNINQVPLSLNYDKQKFDFSCKKSGAYYLSIKYKGNMTTCAIVLLFFVGKV